MAYSDDTQYPRGSASVADLASAWTPFAATVSVKVASIVLRNTSAAAVDFEVQNGDGTVVYDRVTLGADTTIVLPGFHSPTGLRVVGAASCAASVKYFNV